ncbi:MAG: hypothetical protein WBA76_00130 [Phormidesmis sp.]
MSSSSQLDSPPNNQLGGIKNGGTKNTDSAAALTTALPLNVISANAIQPEIQALWETLSAKETASILGSFFKLLWTLLVRLFTIISLGLLIFAVIIVWFWSICYQAGRAFKQIFVTDNADLGGPQIVNGLARLILIPAKLLAKWVEYQIKVQFGKDFTIPLPSLGAQLWQYPSGSANPDKANSEANSD